MKTTLVDKKISIKTLVIVFFILVVLVTGGYYGHKYFIKYEADKVVQASKVIIGNIAKLAAPVNGKCQIINLSYEENGQTKMEKIVNLACANVPTPPTPENKIEEPTFSKPESINP